MDQFFTIILNHLLNPEIAFLAYSTDWLIGEFKIKHPVSFMGDYISWFEKKFYSNSVAKGGIVTLSLVLLTCATVLFIHLAISLLPDFLSIILLGLIGSTGLAGKMLYDSVKAVISSPDPAKTLSYLVSRDTENMTVSDINKGAIETYAENLSDGVIAPLFYLILFGIEGMFIYKAINTLDSMIGYRSQKYELFGKISARIDDVLNYIPARLSTLVIALISFRWKALIISLRYASGHSSPNAGYPISAMAGALGISLGGPTSYQGKLKFKPYFGNGRKAIEKTDLVKALALRKWVDSLIIGGLLLWIIIKNL